MDWAALQALLENRLPGNPVVNDEEAIEKCVEELTSTIQQATAAPVPKRRTHVNQRPLLPARIQDEIAVNAAVANQEGPNLTAQVIRVQGSVTYRLNEWRNEKWSDMLDTLDSENKSLWKMRGRRQIQLLRPLASAVRSISETP
jgi:hypothetical protein